MLDKILSFLGLQRKGIAVEVSFSSHSSSTQTFDMASSRNFSLGDVPSAILRFLEDSGLTKAAFARKCGVSVMTIDRNIKRELAGGYPSISLLNNAALAAGYHMEGPKLEPKDPEDARFKTA